jgi:hypothetical protein
LRMSNKHKIIQITACIYLVFSQKYGNSWLFSRVSENLNTIFFKNTIFWKWCQLSNIRTPMNTPVAALCLVFSKIYGHSWLFKLFFILFIKKFRNFKTWCMRLYGIQLQYAQIIPIAALYRVFSLIYGHSWLFSRVFENSYSRNINAYKFRVIFFFFLRTLTHSQGYWLQISSLYLVKVMAILDFF